MASLTTARRVSHFHHRLEEEKNLRSTVNEQMRSSRTAVKEGRSQLNMAWKKFDEAVDARKLVAKKISDAEAETVRVSGELKIAHAERTSARKEQKKMENKVKKLWLKLNKASKSLPGLSELVVNTYTEFVSAFVCKHYGFRGVIKIPESVPRPLARKLLADAIPFDFKVA